MSIPLPLTDDVVAASLKCPYKAYLRLTGVPGQSSEYVLLHRTLDDEGRAASLAAWLRRRPRATISAAPPSLAAAGGADVITDVTLTDEGEACRFEALERADGGPKSAARYIPVAFLRSDRVTVIDRLRLAFGAGVLVRVQKARVPVGRIVHGPKFTALRLDLGPLARRTRVAAAAASRIVKGKQVMPSDRWRAPLAC